MFFSEKQWTQKIFRNVLQCFMQEKFYSKAKYFIWERKNYSIFSDMQVFVKIRLNIFYNTLHNSHRNNNLTIGVWCIYIYNHRYLLNSWPKNMLLSEHMNTIYHMYHVHYILPIFWYDRNICNYTCKYCTGLWISWYKGEMKWGKKNTAIVY